MSLRIRVAGAASLGDKQTLKFFYDEDGQRKEGFVVRFGGALHAYRNECRHIPVTLDWVENRFFSSDGCYLQCATHGALFEPESGLCVDGPPAGERLHKLDFEMDGEDAVVLLAKRRF